MATIEELEAGLRKAHAAGNADHARRFADAIRQQRGSQPAQVGMSGVTREQRQADIARMDAERAQRDAGINAQTGRARAVNLTGRGILEGVVALPDMVVSPLVDLFNRATEKAPTPSSLITGQRERYVPEQMNLTQGVNYLADLLGGERVRPETGEERVMTDTVRGITAAATPVGIGRQLAQRALSPVAQRVGQVLQSNPGAQIVGGGLSGAAQGGTREAGGGTGSQIAAAFLGGLSPTVPGALARLATRGTNPAAMQRTIDDFASVGTTPSLGQATGNWAIQGIENLLAGGPTSGGVMARAAESQADEIGRGLQARANRLSPNASAERAGRAVERGVNKFAEGVKENQARLYGKVDELIPAQTAVDISNTRNAIGAVNAPIPGAPNTSRLFQNSRIAGIGRALDSDLDIPTSAQTSLDEALAKIDDLYASRDAATQDAGRFSAFANDQANRIDSFFPVEGMPRISGRYSPSVQRAAEGTAAAGEATGIARGRVSQAKEIESTIGQLQAAADASGGKLPYEAIRKLRTLVGQELEDAGVMSDFPRSKFRALYAALSRDMESAAKAQGPQAEQAWRRANTYNAAAMRRLEDIEGVVDKAGGPEAIYNAALQGTRDGGTRLRQVMQSLHPEGQRAVTAGVLRRMGMANPGAQDAAGEVFSAQTFLRKWNDISPEAKKALFDRHGPGFSSAMDRLARVSENIRDGSKVFANPAGTANKAAAYTYGASLVASLLDPTFISTGGLVAGGIGSNLLARAMTNPNVVKRLATASALEQGAIQGVIQSMRAAGEAEGDQDLIDVADALQAQDQSMRQR